MMQETQTSFYEKGKHEKDSEYLHIEIHNFSKNDGLNLLWFTLQLLWRKILLEIQWLVANEMRCAIQWIQMWNTVMHKVVFKYVSNIWYYNADRKHCEDPSTK